MRELEEMIAAWRRSLRGRLRAEVIEEIEDHLRQRVGELRGAQHDLETAFATALREIGPPEAFAAEFAKIESNIWWPIKLALAMLCVVAVLSPGFLIAHLHDKPLGLLLGVHVFTITLGYLAIFMIGMFGSGYVFQRCLGEFPSAKASRVTSIAVKFSIGAAVFVAIGIVLGAVWADITWGRVWANDPKELGGACVLAWTIGFIAAARSGAVSAKALMLLAIFGGIVVSAGWLGAHYLVTHSEFAKAQFLALVCAHAVPFALGFLPAGWLRLTKQST